jgi:hypothetical protein
MGLRKILWDFDDVYASSPYVAGIAAMCILPLTGKRYTHLKDMTGQFK